jgi:hypothetical protein
LVVQPQPTDPTVYVRAYTYHDTHTNYEFDMRSRSVIKNPDDSKLEPKLTPADKSFANGVWELGVALEKASSCGPAVGTGADGWKSKVSSVVKSFNSRTDTALPVVMVDNEKWYHLDPSIRTLNCYYLPDYGLKKSRQERQLIESVAGYDKEPVRRAKAEAEEARK